QQVAAGREPAVKESGGAPPRGDVEVHHHVAAEDDVHLADQREHGLVEDVDVTERAQRAHALAHAVLSVALPEPAAPGGLARGPERGVAVDAAARDLQDAARHVGAEDAHLPVGEQAALQDEDRGGVDLLAGGAAGGPYGEAAAARAPGVEVGEDLLGERLQLLRLAGEICLLGGYAIAQPVHPEARGGGGGEVGG